MSIGKQFLLLLLHWRVTALKRDDHSGQTDCRKIKHDPVDYSRPLPEKEGILEAFPPFLWFLRSQHSSALIGWLSGGGSIRMAVALLEPAQVPGGLQVRKWMYFLFAVGFSSLLDSL